MAEETPSNADPAETQQQHSGGAGGEDADEKAAPAAGSASEAQSEQKQPKTAGKRQAKASASQGKSAQGKGETGKKQKKTKLEDKPFAEFIQQDYVPRLQEAAEQAGIADLELAFTQGPVPTPNGEQPKQCSQVVGTWRNGTLKFILYFLDEDISGQKAFTYQVEGAPPSTVESFMIDERKVTLELLVLYVLERINARKWLAGN